MKMSENRVLRGLIVDDETRKIEAIQDAFSKCGGIIVATAINAFNVRDLYEASEISPDKVDVAFIDSNLGSGMGGGKEVLRYLFMNGIVRRPIGFNAQKEEVVPAMDKIVTVGASSEVEWATEIGSYSDVLRMPLFVDWNRPLDFSFLVSEVCRLKPIE